MQNIINQLISKIFKPEFINRLDESIIFNSLSKANLGEIITIQIEKLKKRLKGKNLSIEVSESAIEWISINSYNPNYGARPLKREIQKEIETPIAKLILKGIFPAGSNITIELEKDELVFS